MKRIFLIVFILSISLFVVLGYAVWLNNRPVREISQNEIKTSFNKSIEWLLKNKTNILQSKNHLLWWMIYESALITEDERLVGLSEEYKHIMKTRYANSIWNHLFDKKSNISIDLFSIAGLPDYNKLYLFGLTCDEELSSLDIIKMQKDVNFCWKTHPISPACITHQLLGFRFMKRRNCQNDRLLNNKIASLQNYLSWQLFFDFRVVDVYIQRVLMLAESDLKDAIKPIWVKRIIEAQLEDGGWDGFQGLVPVGKSKHFGFSAYGVTVKKAKSNFHATAQGVFLMSLMQK